MNNQLECSIVGVFKKNALFSTESKQAITGLNQVVRGELLAQDADELLDALSYQEPDSCVLDSKNFHIT